MFYPKTKLLTPIAAALALAMATGGAAAASPNNMNPQQYTNNGNQQSTDSMNQNQQSANNMNQQSTGNMNQQSWNNGNQQSANNMNQQSWNNRSQHSRNAYREGQIWASYVLNPALQSYKIASNVQGHKVTLTGTVNTKYEKSLAGTIAQQTKGITNVDNQIKVDPTLVVVTAVVPTNAYAQHVRNATTSAEINSQLLWNQYTDGLDINVKTRSGKVTLSGVADTQRAKQRAGKIAAETRGVTFVNNQLNVSGKAVDQRPAGSLISDNWIKSNLRSSYKFTAGVSQGNIDVRVNNRRVTLSGTVNSNTDRERAIAIAQQTKGVEAVNAGGLQVAPYQVATTN